MLKKGTWTRDAVVAAGVGLLSASLAYLTTGGEQFALWPWAVFFLPPFVVVGVVTNTKNRKRHRAGNPS